MKTFWAHTVNDLPAIAQDLLVLAGEKKVWLLEGEMGAGKTTLTKEICQALEVVSGMSSPTFSIVNEYLTANGKKVYHFDLYRIKKPAELTDIGFEEYLDSGHYCLIEWPEIASDFYDNGIFSINIVTENGARKITAE